jgi:PAS domain S-box-containing protein
METERPMRRAPAAWSLAPRTLRGRLVVAATLLAVAATLMTALVGVIVFAPIARTEFTRDVITRAVIAAAIATAGSGLFGVLLSLYVARVIRRPIDRMVEHLETQGSRAIEGVPYVADGLLDDPALLVEFHRLGGVTQSVLERLSQRQAELTRAVADLRAAEKALAPVIDASTEAKMVIEDGRLALANPAAELLLGRAREALVGASTEDLFAGMVLRGEDGRAIDADALFQGALGDSFTVGLERTGTATRWLVVQSARLVDGSRRRYMLSARDITEERRLQQIRGEIVSLISHDMRSPLAVVVGYLDLLRKSLSDEERGRAIDAAKRNAGKMADLLEDLLAATRAEQLLAPSALLPVPLSTLAGEVVSSMAPTHTDRELRLDIDCEPLVLGDEKRLRQVLVNLLTNAFKYSPDGRPVTVRVSCEGDQAQLSVIDSGPGVPEADREQVFDRFTRLDKTSVDTPGTGLGLYIVRTISENHGGSVRIEDTPGGGATFVVGLPLSRHVPDVGSELGQTGAETPEASR